MTIDPPIPMPRNAFHSRAQEEEKLAEDCRRGDCYQPQHRTSLILGQFVQEHGCEEAAGDREYLHDALVESGGGSGCSV
ncbi:hypothetical protein GCM10020255_031170 [Rhodococcus baikonurensis]